MNIRPTPLTAAVAGVVAALAWPFIWANFGGSTTGGSVEFIVAMLLVIALPAHAFVVGFTSTAAATPRTLDTALFKRIGAWLGAAGVVALGRTALGL